MNKIEPLKWKEINFNNIVCHKIKKNENKKIILIKYLNDSEKHINCVFQTPKLKTQVYDGGLVVEVLLTNKEKDFVEFLSNLEKTVKQLAQQNAVSNNTWFNFNKENSFINFKKLLRHSDSNDNYSLKIKLLNNEEFKTDVLLEDKNINLENGNLTSKIILEFYAIWISENNNFGIILRPILVLFNEIKDKTYNYKFIDDSDSEEINILDTDGCSLSSDIFLKMPCESLSPDKNLSERLTNSTNYKTKKESEKENKKESEKESDSDINIKKNSHSLLNELNFNFTSSTTSTI